MAYQFFPKPQARSSARPAAPTVAASSRAGPPPILPPTLQPPGVAKSGPSALVSRDKESFTPYPHTVAGTYPTPHPHITVEPVKTAHIPSLSRITSLLLPIRYPNSFYTATITDPVIASISRVAVYHDQPVATVTDENSVSWTEKVIGGIRCRLERLESPLESSDKPAPTNLYIQTLHLLSPYRGHGVAASLLNSLLYVNPSNEEEPRKISDLVKHYNICSVTAHVHEVNEDALKWYQARGFKLREGVIDGYYRRLTPSGAKIVQLDVPHHDSTEAQSGRAEVNAPRERSLSPNDADDEDWEKVEIEDDDYDDHGVVLLHESRVFEKDEKEPPTRKRKAERQNGSQAQRR